MLNHKLWVGLLLTLILALAIAPLALADDIINDIDASYELLTLNLGGANRAVTFSVIPQNNDGKQGCNLTGKTTLSVDILSSQPGVVTVSPASLTFIAVEINWPSR